ncbi:MAG: hypothetical protein ABI789_14995, partial [Usitatibacter sp.]
MKTFRAIPVLLMLAGCASGPPLDTTYRSTSQDSRAQYLVIHFTSEDFASSLKVLTQGPVS